MTLSVAVVVLKLLTLVLGGVITYFASKAYYRTGRPSIRALTIGFGLITVGALIAGITDLVFVADRDVALLIETGFTILGFGSILYSLVE